MKLPNLGAGRYHYQWLLVGLLLLAALLRLPRLGGQSFSYDETYSIAVGSAAWPTLFEATISSGVHPPLFYMLHKLSLPLWGITEFGTRFIPLIYGLLTIPLLYRLGKLMFDRQTGLMAALLLTISPIHTWLSRDSRMYALFIMLTIISMYFFWKALQANQRRDWLALTGVNALVFNLHYFSMWIPVIQLAVIVSDFGRHHRRLRSWVLVQFVAGLTFIPWLVALSLREYQSFGIGFLVKPNLADLGLTLWNFTIGASTYLFWPLTALALAVFAIALFHGLRKHNEDFRSAQLTLVLWIVIPLVLVWIMSQRRAFYGDRYFSFMIPALVLLFAFGATRLRAVRWRSLMIAGLIGASGIGLVATRLDPAFLKDDWRGMAAYISEHDRPNDVILLYTTHIKIPVDLYYRGDAPRKAINLNLEQFPVEPLTEGHERAWVVYPYTRRPTHYPMRPVIPGGYWQRDSGRNPILVEWFEAHTDKIVDYQHFRGLELWLVELEPNQVRSTQ